MSSSSIVFPHLGITIKSVGRSFSLFGIDIAYYGIVIALAMLAGIYLARFIARRIDLDPEMVMEFGLIAIVLSVLGARAYYVIFKWDYYGQHPLEILNLRGGGLAIYGGVLTGLLTAVIYCHVKNVNFPRLLDAALPGVLIGQIIGRWGNFFNREAFGGYTDSLFAMQLPLDAVNASDVTEEMLSHIVTLDGVDFIQVHPTFFYESAWNLVLLIVLLLIICRKKRQFDGEIGLLYLLFYGIGRFLIEGLRTDQLLWPGTQLPVSQVLSAILAIGALVILVIKARGHTHPTSH